VCGPPGGQWRSPSLPVDRAHVPTSSPAAELPSQHACPPDFNSVLCLKHVQGSTPCQAQRAACYQDRGTAWWPEVVPLSSISAQSCADAFVNTWISRFGVPATLMTDRGTQFTGATWRCLCSSLGIQHVMMTASNPQSNGMIERFYRQLKEALRARCAGKDWLVEHLPWVLLGLQWATFLNAATF